MDLKNSGQRQDLEQELSRERLPAAVPDKTVASNQAVEECGCKKRALKKVDVITFNSAHKNGKPVPIEERKMAVNNTEAKAASA
jgi:hypothetical protein